MRLHGSLISGNGYKVRLLLTQLGIPFERVEYDLARGETRTSGFLEGINANGRILVLETEDGRFLPESGAIPFFLADGTPYLPGGRFERAQVLRWMFFEQYSQTSRNTRAQILQAEGAAGVGRGVGQRGCGRRGGARLVPWRLPLAAAKDAPRHSATTMSQEAPVVNCQLSAPASAFPAISFTPVMTVAS
jgi:glutathione S-transferase